MCRDVRALCFASALLIVTAFFAAWAQDSTPPASQEPLPTKVVEEASRELVQLDVSIRPSKKNDKLELPDLTVDDLELVVAGQRVEIRYADRLCRSDPADLSDVAIGETDDDPVETAPAAPPIVVPNPVATYVFYIEHKHVTVAGLNVALEMIEQLIPELIRDGNRGILVSSGLKLNQSDLTDDPEVLFEALAEIRSDPRQWTQFDYAAGELDRMYDVLSQPSSEAMAARARMYQREEAMITSNRLTRLSAVLGSLTDLDPPKAVFYFADTIRKNAGLHFLRLVGGNASNPDAPESQLGSFSSEFAMDRVTEEAGAHGVRLYTIHAEGLRSDSLPRGGSAPTHRVNDAEDTLRSLALETGGSFYLGGTDKKTVSRILEQTDSDLSCFYLLSFDPADLKRDAKLPVRVRFNPDGKRLESLADRYEIHARGQLVIMSPGRRKESLLLAAHISSSAVESEPVRGAVIPLGFDDGSYIALVQLAVDNTSFPEGITRAAVWDLGMSRVRKEKVTDSVATRVELSDPRAPVVLETTWSFKPGPSDITAIAYENTIGRLVTAKFDQDWPDPRGADVSIGPIAVLQPTEAVFVRALDDGQTEQREFGPLAVEGGAIRVDRPTYVIALVCRDKGFTRDLWLARELVGETAVDFELQTWSFDGQRCVQLRDRIDADQVGWGDFEYRIRVHENAELEDRPIAESSRSFVAAPGDGALSMLE